MTLILYFTCFVIAVVGAALQAALYLRSTQQKSRLANIAFNPSPIYFLKNDWLSVAVSMLTIILTLLLIGELIQVKPEIINYVKVGFAFIGYFSSDVASRLFGAVNKKVNQIIDEKTTTADQQTGTLNTPTPMK